MTIKSHVEGGTNEGFGSAASEVEDDDEGVEGRGRH
jgi:hypothetical protein